MNKLDYLLWWAWLAVALVKFGFGGPTEKTITVVVACAVIAIGISIAWRLLRWTYRLAVKGVKAAPDAATTAAALAGRATAKAERRAADLVGAFKSGRDGSEKAE